KLDMLECRCRGSRVFAPSVGRGTRIGDCVVAPGGRPGSAGAYPNIRGANISRKLLGVLLAMIAFCAIVRAADDPFLGISQLNGEKTSNYQQQSQMIINVPAPGGFTSYRATIGKDNQSSTETHPVAFDGK